jgi:uncharacterized membrane protein YgcG
MATKSRTTRRNYNPNRRVTSTFARDVRKNAEALKIGGGIGGIINILGAGLEPKPKMPKQVKRLVKKTTTSKSSTKRLQGTKGSAGKTRKSTSRGFRGGRGGGGGSSGGWATIDGRRIPLS